MRRMVLLGMALIVGGCASFRPTVPMRSVADHPHGSERAGCLFVMLPGFGDEPEGYYEHGFASALRESGACADVTAVDSHFGYYRSGTVIDRLHEDVIQPARKKGYERVWLVGISMGGLGALGYASAHPDNIDGVVLLAPFLGSEGLVQDVKAAGGPKAWARRHPEALEPKGGEPAWRAGEEAFFRYMWAWVGERHRPDGSSVPIYLGYGRYDRLAPANRVLAQALPERHSLRAYGQHKWPVWKDLWHVFTERGFLQRSCGMN